MKATPNRHRVRRLWVSLVLSVALAGCAEEAPGQEGTRYTLSYAARLVPETGSAEVTLTLNQPRDLLRVLDFNAPANRFSGFEGDGTVNVEADRVHWEPPETGGKLQYQVTIDRLRGNVHDARITDRWAVFRLDDLFPPARARALAVSEASAELRLTGPDSWRFETPFGPSNRSVHQVPGDRLFPRPTGWAVAGEIGVRRDRIAGRRVAVAAPTEEGFRRQDTLAFLRWTLPALVEVFPGFPERLLIVGSGRDMWRGGLSGPASLYLHPDRPIISGNGTSTLIHELVHVAIGSTPSRSDDWLVEGLAEYYALEILRRTGGISQRRFDDALTSLADWAQRDGGSLTNPSTGADTAFAVLHLQTLAGRLAGNGASLDALVAELVASGELTGEALAGALERRGVAVGPRHQERAP